MGKDFDLTKTICDWIDHTSDAIYIADAEGYTRMINKTYQEISGLRAEELVGKNLRDLVSEGYFSSVILRSMETKAPETMIAYQFKSKISMISTSTPIRDDHGEIYAYVAIHRRISDYEKLQEEYVQLKKELQRLEKQNKELLSLNDFSDKEIIPGSKMQQLLKFAIQVAPYDTPVYLFGETGVGKEIVANFIVEKSSRKDKPFIKINCSAIPENLLESELFGYQTGAFTGAHAEGKPGLFELADGGTILLDEIGDMPIRLQAKILRVIQEQEITRLGGVKPIKIDVRVISCTNKDLEKLVGKGNFREDLFFRINVVQMEIPPLRQRKDEILPLTELFLEKLAARYGLRRELTKNAKQLLLRYDWPGNIRELENLIENVLISTEADFIDYEDIAVRMARKMTLKAPEFNENTSLRETMEIYEKQIISRVLQEKGSIRSAAKILGMDHATLLRRMKKYKLQHSHGAV